MSISPLSRKRFFIQILFFFSPCPTIKRKKFWVRKFLATQKIKTCSASIRMNHPQPTVNVPQRSLLQSSVSEFVREKLHDMSRLLGADVDSPSVCKETAHLRDGSIPDEEKEPRRVGFGHMVILDFPCVLGDNPSVSVGTPIAMSPRHRSRRVVGIDEYEHSHPTDLRLKESALILTRMERTMRSVKRNPSCS
jgi:hypothetical protein